MNKILMIFLVFIIVQVKEIDVDEYSKTGHEQFAELEFVKDGHQLLVDMPQMYIDMKLRSVKSKFWGTSTVSLYEYEDAKYVGNIIFSRSNKTQEKYIFNYSLQDVEYFERSVSVEGSLTLKASGKIKKVETGGAIDVKGKYQETESSKHTEESSMSVTVYPNKKITLRVTGEAKISSGFSKYYVFWICFEKGAWETVDIVTSYFELVEENA